MDSWLFRIFFRLCFLDSVLFCQKVIVLCQFPASGAQLRAGEVSRTSGGASASRRTPPPPRPDYSVAVYTVKLRRRPPNEMLELGNFDGRFTFSDNLSISLYLILK